MKESHTAENLQEQMQDFAYDEDVVSDATDADEYAGESVDVNAEDCWSYEVPRPWLTIEEAASMLGRSVRGVERSIVGRWGNKLPEGWQARRVRMDGKDEWRIVPPPGFRVKHSKKLDPAAKEALARFQQEQSKRDLIEAKERALQEALEEAYAKSPLGTEFSDDSKTTFNADPDQSEYDYNNEDRDVTSKTAEAQSGFSLEKLFQSASQLAQKELASLGLNVKNQLMVDSQNHAAGLDVEHTIVIDRSDEVEKLLRELANVQKELAEERRLHMEDMRLMSQMQNNMRLLEMNATQTSELKEDLQMAQKLLAEHKKQYQAYLALPWWKKIFKSQP
ncbi:MAG: hypothetical protein JSS83_00430 [Cyanobacteria bacterium SZAS LIN-3]|nr:hypothetical protein [Cyanobacteria bacterium SZAS LIN-3]